MPIPKKIVSKNGPLVVSPPPTLESFFKSQKPKAKTFVGQLIKAKARRFSDEDIAKSRQALRERSDGPKVIHELAFAAYSSKDLEVRRICMAEVVAELDRLLRAEFSWSPSDEPLAETAFDALVSRYSGRKNSKESQRSTSILLSVALWLHTTKGLRGIGTATALSSNGSPKGPGTDVDKLIFNFLAKPPAKPKNLVALSTLVATFGERASADRTRATDLQIQLAELQVRMQEKQKALEDLQSNLNDLEARNQQKQAALDAAVEEARVQTMHHQNQLSKLKGEIQGRLSGRASRLLRDAKDAASVSPASTAVVKERLELLHEEIEGTLQWLASE